jgi:hypothetical protein
MAVTLILCRKVPNDFCEVIDRVTGSTMENLNVSEKAGVYEQQEGTLKWCSREDLNLHGLPHTILSRTRLPIPPRELRKKSPGTISTTGTGKVGSSPNVGNGNLCSFDGIYRFDFFIFRQL